MLAAIETRPRPQAVAPAARPPRAALPLQRGEAAPLAHSGELYGACTAMRQLFADIERLAPTSATVLILGESGSGKELVVARIHELSPRAGRPFVAVNCAALPETLIESELFGHERGSFTGASRQHRGCFERAHGGTLFLDEIAEMPREMQVRLLRVLESRRFARVGGDAEIAVDARVIAATNRDPRAAVREGRLREDLLYRLCVVPLRVPALRDRDCDALLLAQRFLDAHNRECGIRKRLAASMRERIAAHPWPGNVRELRNAVHRAFVLSDDEIDVDLELPTVRSAAPAEVAAGERPSLASTVAVQVGVTLAEPEQALILATLDAVNGSKAQAAKLLGISIKTLYNRLQAYRGPPAPPRMPSNRWPLAAAA